MIIELHDVYDQPTWDGALAWLWLHLAQRTPEQSISHKEMPSPSEHACFVQRRPYQAWFLITTTDGQVIGNIYLTHAREVGLHVDPAWQRKGAGDAALRKLQERYQGEMLANINPLNTASIEFFAKHGFRLLQQTYQRTQETQ